LIASLDITNFKPFERLYANSFGRINLIAGLNNVGKTALLEAIYLILGGQNIELNMRTLSFRGLGQFQGDPAGIRDAAWAPFFHKLNALNPFSIETTLDNGSTARSTFRLLQTDLVIRPTTNSLSIEPTSSTLVPLGLSLAHDTPDGRTLEATITLDPAGFKINPSNVVPFLPGYFVGSRPLQTPIDDANLFSQLQTREEPHAILEALQVLEPRLKRLAVILSAGVPMLHADVGLPKMIPLLLMGDGIRRMALIHVAIANSRGGVVLIDDIELGVHHSTIPSVWRSLANAAQRFDTQLFATTHSYEWIAAAAKTEQESFLSDLRLHRLERTNGAIRLVTYDKEAFQAAIDSELEVR